MEGQVTVRGGAVGAEVRVRLSTVSAVAAGAEAEAHGLAAPHLAGALVPSVLALTLGWCLQGRVLALGSPQSSGESRPG